MDNLLVQIHSIVVMITWTGLAPWKFESPFSGSYTSIFVDVRLPGKGRCEANWKREIKAIWERELKLPWSEAGPPNHGSAAGSGVGAELLRAARAGAHPRGTSTSPRSGSRSFYLTSLICTTSDRIPASSSTNHEPEECDLIPT